MRRLFKTILVLAGVLLPSAAFADGGVCPRPPVGSEIQPPPDLFSVNGTLETSLDYYTSVDDEGRTLFCFVTTDGKLSPTLHANPGDKVVIHLTDRVPNAPLGRAETMTSGAAQCGDSTMTDASVNMHFHGLNISPRCHGDEVIHTLIGSGESFDYVFHIPPDEPPGLYWYHPHVHTISSIAVQGGGTGLIEVQGIQNIQPAVAGLPERFIALRDEPLVGNLEHQTHWQPVPNWDVSVNYVTVPFPKYTPSVIKMHAGQREFWRVANASANTIMDLRVKYDGVDQPLQVVGFDGVPAGSQDGTRQGTIVTETGALLPPAGRVEFMLDPPPPGVNAVLETQAIEGGPASDTNPTRPLAQIQLSDAPLRLPHVPAVSGPPNKQRFEALADARVTARRHLYFLEIPVKMPGQPPAIHPPVDQVKFYIAVEGQQLQFFDPNEPPQIVTNRGAVEEWRIQNRTAEVHEFHMHQIHFLVQEISGKRIPKNQQQFYDTFQVPYWKGKGPYPYIKVKMDFRGAVTGDFVYHCHILDHEDFGMMAVIRVLPNK